MVEQLIIDDEEAADLAIEIEGKFRAELAKLPKSYRLMILARLKGEQRAEHSNGSTSSNKSSNVSRGTIDKSNGIAAAVEKMLNEAENGLSVGDVAAALYSDQDPGRSKHSARSILRYLKKKGIAGSVDDRWYAKSRMPHTPATVAMGVIRKTKPGTVVHIVKRSIQRAGTPLPKRSLVEAVRKSRRGTTPDHVNSEVSRMVQRGELIKANGPDGKSLYSLPTNGGATK